MLFLIVEDDEKMASLLERGLKAERHGVVIAHSGKEGLETALAGRFDAIVLDVMLPQIDGFEVARRLREPNNQTPILMLTAQDAISDKVRGLDRGAAPPFRNLRRSVGAAWLQAPSSRSGGWHRCLRRCRRGNIR